MLWAWPVRRPLSGRAPGGTRGGPKRGAIGMAILYRCRPDGVAEITLDRPRVLNALDSEGKRQLAQAWRQAAGDDAVRAVLLSGNGRAFCAGSDIKEMARDGRAVSTEELLQALPGAVEPFDKPIVAALHGYCVGVGLTLALHCDLRLCAAGTVLGFPEVRHGMISAVSAVRLPLMMAAGRALELLLLGETVSATEAERVGLVNRVVTAGDAAPTGPGSPDEDRAAGAVRAEADRLAQRLADLAPEALRSTKRLAGLALRRTLAALHDEIDGARRRVEASLEFAERAQAFAEGRA